MTPFQFFIAACATWYVSYVVTSSEGPQHVFARLRNWRGGRWHGRTTEAVEITALPGEPPIKIGERINSDGLLDCIICMSVWVAFVVVAVTERQMNLMDTLAVAGLTLFLHGYTGWRHTIS